MATRGDSEGFVSTPLEDKRARPSDSSSFPLSDENASELKETDREYRKVKSDFLQIAQNNRRQRDFSRSESSRSPPPVYRRSTRRSHNLQKFEIATFYPTDVEVWFNHAFSGEVASDVRDILLQPFLTRKYENFKGILIERRGSTTPERVNNLISGEKNGSDIPSRFLRRLQKTAGFSTAAVVGKAVIRQAFIR